MSRLTARDKHRHAYFPQCFEEPCCGSGCQKDACEFLTQVCEGLAKYEETGLTPDRIRQIDELYAEKCKELAEYKKLEDRLCKMFDGVLQLKTAVDELERYLTEPGKPHPTHARILTYDESDWYDRMREAEKNGRLHIADDSTHSDLPTR